MGIYLTNSTSLLSVRSSIYSAHASINKAFEKLSSGLRINWASDDPAELVISEQFRSQIATLNQEIENINNLVGKYKTTSSYLSEMRSSLTELRSIAVAASNTGFNSEEAQEAYTAEATALVTSYNYILETAQYNGSKLLNGEEGSLVSLEQLGSESVDFSDPESIESAIVAIDRAASELDTAQVELGSTQKNNLEAELRSKQISRENLISAESSLRDTDYAAEISNMILARLQLHAGLAVLSHYKMTTDTVLKLFG